MKRCPTCNKTYTEQYLTFCLDDGTPLVRVEEPAGAGSYEQTIVSPSAQAQAPGPTEPRYQPPGAYVPPGGQPGQKRKTWPWAVAILAIVLLALLGLGVAAATFIPSILRASRENEANRNVNSNRPILNGNSNANSQLPDANSNAEYAENANDDDESHEEPPPTNESDVLVVLTDLEHEWTVANINADKKKLNRILADDYVGTTSDGKAQGKASYLKTIERDTSIQKWAFEDLKVSLRGDRASLTGVLRLDVQNQQGDIVPLAFRFTDKFVWRDNRWQAVGSEVAPVAE